MQFAITAEAVSEVATEGYMKGHVIEARGVCRFYREMDSALFGGYCEACLDPTRCVRCGLEKSPTAKLCWDCDNVARGYPYQDTYQSPRDTLLQSYKNEMALLEHELSTKQK